MGGSFAESFLREETTAAIGIKEGKLCWVHVSQSTLGIFVTILYTSRFVYW